MLVDSLEATMKRARRMPVQTMTGAQHLRRGRSKSVNTYGFSNTVQGFIQDFTLGGGGHSFLGLHVVNMCAKQTLCKSCPSGRGGGVWGHAPPPRKLLRK